MSGVFLAVSIDCECDKGAGWRCQRPLEFQGVREGVAGRIAPLFRAYGARPTYLLSPEVVGDPASAEVFAAQGDAAELGAHLHGELAEPGAFLPEVTTAFQRDYPPEVEAAKVASLTALFRSTFGRAPRSFRAGRFGAGPRTLGILESLGYVVDSSVTPHVSWEGSGAPGLSFRGAPSQPYHPARHAPGQRGEGDARAGLLEVPVTIRPHALTRVPLLGRLAAPRWLRPSRTRAAALLRVAREEIVEARRASPAAPVVLNAMFHNVEVVAGASPYAATERGAQAILARVDALLAFAARESIRVVTLAEVGELFA